MNAAAGRAVPAAPTGAAGAEVKTAIRTEAITAAAITKSAAIRLRSCPLRICIVIRLKPSDSSLIFSDSLLSALKIVRVERPRTACSKWIPTLSYLDRCADRYLRLESRIMLANTGITSIPAAMAIPAHTLKGRKIRTAVHIIKAVCTIAGIKLLKYEQTVLIPSVSSIARVWFGLPLLFRLLTEISCGTRNACVISDVRARATVSSLFTAAESAVRDRSMRTTTSISEGTVTDAAAAPAAAGRTEWKQPYTCAAGDPPEV